MSNEWKKKLRDAKEMLDDGLISESQYTQTQEQALSAMGMETSSSAPVKDPSPSSGLKNRLGSYELKGEIGSGGQGSVYRGRHTLSAKAA